MDERFSSLKSQGGGSVVISYKQHKEEQEAVVLPSGRLQKLQNRVTSIILQSTRGGKKLGENLALLKQECG